MKYKSLVLAILLGGAALTIRLIFPGLRPMHTDEAVHAIKFGKLLEEGTYRYDPDEYHGPTLNYLTLIPAWLLSQEKITEVNEFTLRSVPAFLGAGLVILLLLVSRYMQLTTWILSALCITLSPVLVFYSRYYIHEILMVFFLYGFVFCMIRWKDSPTIKWAFWAGFFGGMMIATKETWIISVVSMIVSLTLLLVFNRYFRIRYLPARGVLIRNFAWMSVVAILVASLFYSSFIDNPKGIVDSIITYAHYIQKSGDFTKHIHPWYYYLELLIFNRGGTFIWTEAFLFLGGWTGFIFALKQQQDAEARFFLFMALFSIISGVSYSALPYKTPWNLLSFYTGWILVAGYGFSCILRVARTPTAKRMVYLLLFLVFSHLSYQTFELNFVHYADPSNPWVYGHTGKDLQRLIEKVETISTAQPAGKNLRIDIIAANHDYWPLPWYLRGYPDTGWWDRVQMDQPAAPLILASPEFKPDILKKIYEDPPPGQRYLYLPLFNELPELRPQILLEGYIRKDVWDNWKQKSDPGN